MKKLILAPAVALAFTGLVAAPVAAAESPSTQSADAAGAKAEQLKKDKAEQAKKAEAKKAAEKKAAAKKAAEDKAAKDKKSDSEVEPKKTTPAKADPKPAPAPKDKGDEKPKDDSKSDEDKSDDKKTEKLNASLKLSISSIKAEDLAEDGIKVTVSNLEKGDKVSTNGGDLTASTTTASDSTATLTLHTSKAPEGIAKTQHVVLKVQRAGVSAQSLTSNVAVDLFAEPEVDPKVSIDTKKISQSDFKKNSIKVTGEGFTPNGKVNLMGNAPQSPFYEKEIAADENGKVTGTVTPPEDGLDPGNYTITAFDFESDVSTPAQEFTLAEDAEGDPSIKLEADKISVSDFKQDGLPFTGEGFSPNGTVSVESEAVSTQRAAAQADKATADENGKVSGTVTAPELIEAGTYSLTFFDDTTGEESDPVEVSVTEDDESDEIDASLKVTPKKITATDLADKGEGMMATVSGVKKGDKITDSLTGKTETADADGDYKLHLYYQGDAKDLEEGKLGFTVTIEREGTESVTLNGATTIVAEDNNDGRGDGDDQAPADASFSVSPKSIEAADFANDKKGVKLSVENCEAGSDVRFRVNPKGLNVTAYDKTVKADDEGRASVTVFGTSENYSAYVGSYSATASCGDDTMKDSFKVTAGAKGGDSSDGGSGNGNGTDLPRTGADLGGLTTGALLLLVGGAAVVMTGRRKKVGQSPTDI